LDAGKSLPHQFPDFGLKHPSRDAIICWMFESLEPGGEAPADHKSRAYCASVYGFFFLLGTLCAVVAFFSKHGPLHVFDAACFLAECVLALWFLVEARDQGPQTERKLSRRASLLMMLGLLPNFVHLFVI
jgi:hypothetical protein